MASIVTQALVAEKYGIRLSTRDLAEVLSLAAGTIRNQISRGTFPIPTYQDGGRQWADYRDVAAYLDQMRDGGQKED